MHLLTTYFSCIHCERLEVSEVPFDIEKVTEFQQKWLLSGSFNWTCANDDFVTFKQLIRDIRLNSAMWIKSATTLQNSLHI